VAARPKLVADCAEHGTKARRMPQALESLQPSLTLPDGLVRVFDAIVLAPAPEMGDGRHHVGFGRRVARQPRSLLIIRQSSSTCQMFEHAPRVRRNRRAYSRPKRSVQRRMAS
jgi:hypothetical protein